MPDSAGSEIYLSDLSARDEPWDRNRASASTVQTLYEGTEHHRLHERMMECAQLLEFGTATDSEGEKRLHLTGSRFCRVRHCPTCQWRRSLMWTARALQGMPRIESDYPKARWIFITLTVKNCPVSELRQTVQKMNKAFKRLSERAKWPCLGWAKSLEVTRNPKTGEAHPHFHILGMVKPSYFTYGYIKQADWRELWRDCLRVDYLPVVNVKTVKPKKLADGSVPTNTDAIRETFKYTVKPDDLTADREWLLELTDQLHNSRAIAIGGVLRTYWKANEPEDLINTDEDGSVELDDVEYYMLFGWREKAKRYAYMNRRTKIDATQNDASKNE